MRLKDKMLGDIEITIRVTRSAVDSVVESGWSNTFNRELTDWELDYVAETYADEVQEYAYENGSRSHN